MGMVVSICRNIIVRINVCVKKKLNINVRFHSRREPDVKKGFRASLVQIFQSADFVKED